MFRNYIVTAIRNIIKNKLASIVAIFGLAIGIACSLLVFLYIQYEYSFDHFHEKKDRIYRVIIQGKNAKHDLEYWSTTTEDAASAFKNKIPSIQKTVRLGRADAIVGIDDVYFSEDGFCFVDCSVFDVFTFPLIIGDPKTVLYEPNSVVITKKITKKYFGEEDPIGKTISFQNQATEAPIFFTITGVCENAPKNSSIQFDFLASFKNLEILYSKMRSSGI